MASWPQEVKACFKYYTVLRICSCVFVNRRTRKANLQILVHSITQEVLAHAPVLLRSAQKDAQVDALGLE